MWNVFSFQGYIIINMGKVAWELHWVVALLVTTFPLIIHENGKYDESLAKLRMASPLRDFCLYTGFPISVSEIVILRTFLWVYFLGMFSFDSSIYYTLLYHQKPIL